MLSRMRTGDRAAGQEFLMVFGDQIRRRIHGKLGGSIRRVYDSQEILSTLGRRLDGLVLSGELRAVEAPQLWKLVFKIIDIAVKDKVRRYSRLEAAEGEDSGFAAALATRMRMQERTDTVGADLERQAAFDCLRTDIDRKMLAMWLSGMSHAEIAEALNVSIDAVRQRWHAIRQHLQEQHSYGAI